MKFVLVYSNDPDEFVEEVQQYLDNGYELRGETFSPPEGGFVYNQALVKEELNKRSKN